MYVYNSACVRVKEGENEELYRGVSCPFGCLVYIYGWSDEGGEDGDGKEGSELPGGWEKVEIVWPLLCRLLGSMW